MTKQLRTLTHRLLIALVFSLPWEAAHVLPGVGTVSRVLGLLVMPVGLACVVFEGRHWRLKETHLLIGALSLWVTASVLWSIRPFTSFASAFTMMQLVAMVLLIWEFGQDPGVQRKLLWAYVAGAYVGCAGVLQAFIAGEGTEGRFARFSAGGLNANHVGLLLAFGIPIAWYLSATTVHAKAVWLARIYIVVGSFAVVLTASRGALITLLPALAIVPLTFQSEGLRGRAVTLAGLAIAVVVVVTLVPPSTMARLSTIPSEITSGDLNARTEAWSASLEVFSDHPITGVGAGASRYPIQRAVGRVQGPHDTFLSLAADLGFVGIALFLMILLSITLESRRLPKMSARFVQVLMLTLVVGLLPGHWEYLKGTWVIIALAIGMTDAVPIHRERTILPAELVPLPNAGWPEDPMSTLVQRNGMVTPPAPSRAGNVGLLGAIWRHRVAVVGAMVVAGALGYLLSSVLPKNYDAKTRVYLSDPKAAGIFSDAGRASDQMQFVSNEQQRVTSVAVLERAASLLNGRMTAADLDRKVSVTATPDLGFVTITATGKTRAQAVTIANAVEKAYEAFVIDEHRELVKKATDQLSGYTKGLTSQIAGANARLNQVRDEAEKRVSAIASVSQDPFARLDAVDRIVNADPRYQAALDDRRNAQAQLDAVTTKLQEVSVDTELAGSGVRRVDLARPGKTTERPQRSLNALLAALSGLLLGASYAWWRTERSVGIELRDEPSAVLGAPLLGEVPNFRSAGVRDSLPVFSAPSSAPARAYDNLLSFIGSSLPSQNGGQARSLLIVGAVPDEGASVTSMNLALAAGRRGRRTMLVDADFRNQTLATLTGVKDHDGHVIGLGDRGGSRGRALEHLCVNGDQAVRFTPAGSEVRDPLAFFGSAGYREALDSMRQTADLILIDAPPVLTGGDAVAIASRVDGILFVVGKGCPVQALEDAQRWLARGSAPIIGYVFNNPKGRKWRKRPRRVQPAPVPSP